MNVDRIGKRQGFVPSLIGLAVLAVPSAVSSQQQGQAEEQQRQQGDVQVAVAPDQAQQSQPMIWNEVRIVRVKGDRIGEFEGLLKELAGAMTEQDAPGFNVWQVAFGEQNTYHIAAQLESLGALADMAENPPMEPQQWANWVNRIESTMDSHELSISQIHPDLSIMPELQAGAEPPELLILMSQTLLPGKRQEYTAWLRDEMLPALRESDLLGVVSNEVAFGAEGRTWVFAVPVATWATLDEPMPLYESMGPEAAEALMARGDSMVDRSETIVLRTRPDLSAAGGPAGQQSGQQPGQQSGQQPRQPGRQQ
jgi:hypothetical protein